MTAQTSTPHADTPQTNTPLTIIDTKGVAVLVRGELRRAFPATRFSVRVHPTACDSITIRWTDGPRQCQVAALVGRYRRGHHDTLSESYVFEPDRLDLLPGEDTPTRVRYLCTRQTYVRDIGPDGYAAISRRLNAVLPGVTSVRPDGHGLTPGWIDEETARTLRVEPGPLDVQCAAHRLHHRIDLTSA